MANYVVVWRGPIRRASGLGIASREYVSALKRQGVNVKVNNNWTKSPKTGKTKTPKILIYHYPPNTINLKKERKVFDRIILNTVWETSRIPKQWLPKINKFDAICVPSLQNKRAMRNSGVKVPVFIVPHGVNTKLFTPANKKLPVPGSKGRFIFVSVFGFQHRKNPEALLRAYWEEFTPADKTLLVIKTNGYAPFENEKWIKNRIQIYKKRLGIRKKTAPVTIIARRLRPNQQKRIYTLGHVFVLPTRGEGVGLPFLESLSSGVPVIATGWGGHMDFLRGNNSFLIQYKLRTPASSMNSRHAIARQFRYLFAQRGQLWAEPVIGSLRKQMRLARKSPLLCKRKGRQGRRSVLKLTWNRAGASMKKAVENVLRQRKSRRRNKRR